MFPFWLKCVIGCFLNRNGVFVGSPLILGTGWELFLHPFSSILSLLKGVAFFSESAEGKQGTPLSEEICKLVFDPIFEVLWKKAKNAKAYFLNLHSYFD